MTNMQIPILSGLLPSFATDYREYDMEGEDVFQDKKGE